MRKDKTRGIAKLRVREIATLSLVAGPCWLDDKMILDWIASNPLTRSTVHTVCCGGGGGGWEPLVPFATQVLYTSMISR